MIFYTENKPLCSGTAKERISSKDKNTSPPEKPNHEGCLTQQDEVSKKKVKVDFGRLLSSVQDSGILNWISELPCT